MRRGGEAECGAGGLIPSVTRVQITLVAGGSRFLDMRLMRGSVLRRSISRIPEVSRLPQIRICTSEPGRVTISRSSKVPSTRPRQHAVLITALPSSCRHHRNISASGCYVQTHDDLGRLSNLSEKRSYVDSSGPGTTLTVSSSQLGSVEARCLGPCTGAQEEG